MRVFVHPISSAVRILVMVVALVAVTTSYAQAPVSAATQAGSQFPTISNSAALRSVAVPNVHLQLLWNYYSSRASCVHAGRYWSAIFDWDGWFCEGQYQSASIEVWALYYFIS